MGFIIQIALGIFQLSIFVKEVRKHSSARTRKRNTIFAFAIYAAYGCLFSYVLLNVLLKVPSESLMSVAGVATYITVALCAPLLSILGVVTYLVFHNLPLL